MLGKSKMNLSEWLGLGGTFCCAASWKLVWLISEYDEWRIVDISQIGKLYSELIIHIFGNLTFVSNEIEIESYNDYIETLQEFVDIDIERLPVDEE